MVDEWIAERRLRDELIKDWQALENGLSRRAKAEGIDLHQAETLPWREVGAMRDLMKCIDDIDRRLPDLAKAIVRRRSTCDSDAMAKISLGLHMRQPMTDDDGAWELVERGLAELKRCERV